MGKFKVLFDSNFLLIPAKFKVDIFSELTKFGRPELYTLGLVVRELERLAKGKGKTAGHARLGLKLLKMKEVKVLRTAGQDTDREILRIAKKGFGVCTQDAGLAKKLRQLGVPVFMLRQKRFLEKR